MKPNLSEEIHMDKSSSSSSDETEKKEEKAKEESNNLNLSDNQKSSKEMEEEPQVLAEDKERKIEEIITTKGFICQKHFVKTDDGYILAIYRIPGKKEDKNNEENKQPVLFQHGILDSLQWNT